MNNTKTLLLFLFFFIIVISYIAGYNLGAYETSKQYKAVIYDNFNYCVFGDEIFYAPRTPKINLTKIEEKQNGKTN